MDNTALLIDVTDRKVLGFLHEFEKLQWIKIVEEKKIPTKQKLSDKYRGALTKEQGLNLQAHIQKMRQEWDTI
jgi:hypothetical protein